MGAGNYTAPWEFESIAGASNGGRLDFLDTSSAICANCHATANHRAPLWAYFDASGVQHPTTDGMQVTIPVAGVPFAVMEDFLPAGQQQTAFKLGKPANNLFEYGIHMAGDEEVLSCAVARVWNLAMSKGDIVNDGSAVPSATIAELVQDFKDTNYNLRATVRAVFTHDDFVRY